VGTVIPKKCAIYCLASIDLKSNSHKKRENSEVVQIGQQFRPIRWRKSYSKAYYYDIALCIIIICAENTFRLCVLWFSD